MKKRLTSPDLMGAQHSELESFVIKEGLELQRLLLEAHMELRAARERRVAVKGADGIHRRTLRASSRPLVTLVGVGEVTVPRLAYQARDVNGLHPMDSVLNLPPEAYSHGVERCGARRHPVVRRRPAGSRLAHGGPSRQAAGRGDVRTRRRGLRAVLRGASRERRDRGAHARPAGDDVRRQRHRDGPRDLRPATKKAAGKAVRKLATRLTSGEKRNRKRMAQVAAIYTAPSYPRTAENVVADLNRCADREARPARPKVRNKRVWASVAEPAKAIIEETFHEALARDPKHKREWVALLDGNEGQLALVKAQPKSTGRSSSSSI
jgi:hypothetical protein